MENSKVKEFLNPEVEKFTAEVKESTFDQYMGDLQSRASKFSKKAYKFVSSFFYGGNNIPDYKYSDAYKELKDKKPKLKKELS